VVEDIWGNQVGVEGDDRPGDPQRWLTETKFFPPLLRLDIIPRRDLLGQLRSSVKSNPLTLLSAPAGYGKTTILAMLTSTFLDLPVGWISLDEEDNDTVRFLSTVVVALQRLRPGYRFAAGTLLGGLINAGTEVRRIVSVLINDVLEGFAEPFVLVLDDLHLINEPAIFSGLDYLLKYLPPQMHLVISSRRDPPLSLARLRARGQMGEFRLSSLRFSGEEAVVFLNERLDLDLLPEEVNDLHARTEGWAAGLRLLAGSLGLVNSAADRKTFIREMIGTDRFIYEFLADEVFNRQEPPVRQFLLETAILPELTDRLCFAVTGREDAGEMLEWIYNRNLFLVQVDLGAGPAASPGQDLADPSGSFTEPTYRYHDLFAAFLIKKLHDTWPERIPDLHFRAAIAQDDRSRAVNHFLVAGAWNEAAGEIEQLGAKMFTRGTIDLLSRWINMLPTEVRDSHPRLLHYVSNSALWRGEWLEVEGLLQRALEGFEAAGDKAGQGEVLANLGTIAIIERDYQRGSDLFEQALALPTPTHIRVQCLLGRALTNMERGDWEQAGWDFEAAMDLIQQGSKLDLLDLVTFPFFDPGFAFLPGGLERLEQICRQAKTLVGEEISPLRLIIEELMVTLLLFRGQLVEAINSAEKTIALRERLGGHPFLGIESDIFIIIAHAALGNYAVIDPLLDSILQGVELTNSPTIDLDDLLYALGRIRWMQGKLAEAWEIYNLLPKLDNPLNNSAPARIRRTWLWSLLKVAEGDYSTAERALRQPEVLEQRDRRSTISGSTRLMLARLYYGQNRQKEALVELEPALAYYEKLGIPFPVLIEGQSIVPLLHLAVEKGVHKTYAVQLLQMLGANNKLAPLSVPATGATLTRREVEVLRLVMAGSSNQAIADQLVISVWTVKSHLTQIYTKLDVTSRTQAIARALDLGLA